MMKAVLICIVFLVAIVMFSNIFTTDVQSSFWITLNRKNTYKMDCIAKALSINKNDIEHDKHLVFYNCNDHQLGFENIKTRANIPFARRHSLTVNCQKLLMAMN